MSCSACDVVAAQGGGGRVRLSKRLLRPGRRSSE